MWQDQMKELGDGLGEKADMIVADSTFEVSDPTVDLPTSPCERMPVSGRVLRFFRNACAAAFGVVQETKISAPEFFSRTT
jgi:hypothetical protein